MWYLNTEENYQEAWWQVFNVNECKEIIKLGTKIGLQPAKVEVIKSVPSKVDENIRNSLITWLKPNELPEYKWIFEKCGEAVEKANKTVFQYDLDYIELFQFTTYTPEHPYYGKHIDVMQKTRSKPRKLSFTIQLSDTNDYTGGDLLVYSQANPKPSNRTQGVMNLFPSHALHEVTPVTSGTRYSLVGWVCGPKLK